MRVVRDLFRKKWFSWPRLLGMGVTGALLYLMLSRLEGEALGRTLARASWAWVGWAVAANGLGLLLGAVRWHMTLGLTGASVHFGASARLVYIGHFFSVALFGAAGGDVAKSMFYARWYRFGWPEVLATVPLDRGLGGVGQAFVVLLTFGFAFGAAGFHDWQPVQWYGLRTGWMAVVVLIAIAGVALLWWRPRDDHPWTRGWKAFGAGVRQLVRHPVLGRKALGVAMAHQVITHLVFALNLRAVSQDPMPWLQLSWTIPSITLLSCFPISFAGAGVREFAAVTLLGLYGVPASDAVAAALLTLFAKLLWAAVGGACFWRERSRQVEGSKQPLPRSISVVIPVVNESGTLPKTIETIRHMPELCEVIVVDGGSRDNTPAVAANLGCLVLRASRSRGKQLRLGAAHARGEVVWMLHADTVPPENAGRAILNCLRDSTIVAGGFWKVFDDASWLLRGSRFRCLLRLWCWHRIAGDQAMFVRRNILETVGGVPEVPLMEEFELCRLLRRHGRVALAGGVARTSARRFRAHGILRTYLLMGRIHALYWAGASLEELRRIYDRAMQRD